MDQKEMQLMIENQNKKIKNQNKKIAELEEKVNAFINREKQIIKCSEKKVYFNIEEAAADAERYENKFGGKRRGYKCRVCHMFHITSKISKLKI